MLKYLLNAFCLAGLVLTGCATVSGTEISGSEMASATPELVATRYPALAIRKLSPEPETATLAPSQIEKKPTSTASQPYPSIDLRPTQDKALQRIVEAARKYLASEYGIDLWQINLIGITLVNAAQLSPACLPAARNLSGGGAYYLLVFQSAQNQYLVLADRSAKHLTICAGPVPGERIPLEKADGENEIVDIAKENLAQRLDVPPDQVNVVQVDPTEWDDETLGCSQPPGNHPNRAFPRLIFGFRILLSFQGVEYEYHSGGMWLIFCGSSPSHPKLDLSPEIPSGLIHP